MARAIRELGITQIFALSPEAQGRVERANRTFQDRLVAEMRLAGASTLAEANRVLEEFLPHFNHRFGVPPAEVGPAYRRLDSSVDIDGVFCVKERRRVARDKTVQYHGRALQLFPEADRASYAGAGVEVQARLDGRVLVSYGGKVLTPQEAPPLAVTLRAQAKAMAADHHVRWEEFWPAADAHRRRSRTPVAPGPLARDTIWVPIPKSLSSTWILTWMN